METALYTNILRRKQASHRRNPESRDYEVTNGSARVLEELEANRWGIAKLCVRML